jgi:riboflavin biosynthesis pyrimidine reductase
MDSVIQLYPVTNQKLPLKNLYLQQNLLDQYSTKDNAFVYTNFIVSLDGRIAVPRSKGEGMKVPENIANPRDWRLFQELAVQADILITSGRYLRDYSKDDTQEILQVYDNPDFADLKEWRQMKGFRPLPDLAVISHRLDFPIPKVLQQADRTVHIITSESADQDRRVEFQEGMGNVIIAGKEQIEGQQMVDQLSKLGYRTIYSTAGPKILHLLLSANVLDRLYLTYANRIVGGDPFSSIHEGDLLEPAVDFNLRSLYFDPSGLDGFGQLFACYDRA